MTSVPNKVYEGSCLCGKIRYQVDQLEVDGVGHCHCTMCRKFHGAAYATYGDVKLENFHWKLGEELLSSYQADNGTTRKFCSNCGSSLIFLSPKDPTMVELAISTLDDAVDVFPNAHIYVNYKANWTTICDNLPTYGEYRDDERPIQDQLTPSKGNP